MVEKKPNGWPSGVSKMHWFRCPECGWTSDFSPTGFGMANECPSCRKSRGLNLVSGTFTEWKDNFGKKGSLITRR